MYQLADTSTCVFGVMFELDITLIPEHVDLLGCVLHCPEQIPCKCKITWQSNSLILIVAIVASSLCFITFLIQPFPFSTHVVPQVKSN